MKGRQKLVNRQTTENTRSSVGLEQSIAYYDSSSTRALKRNKCEKAMKQDPTAIDRTN